MGDYDATAGRAGVDLIEGYGGRAIWGPIATTTRDVADSTRQDEDDSATVDLDHPVDDSEASTARTPVDANAGAKRVAAILALVLLCAMGVIVGALHAFEAPAADPPAERVARAPMATVAPTTPAVSAPIAERSRPSGPLHRQRGLPGRIDVGTGAHRHHRTTPRGYACAAQRRRRRRPGAARRLRASHVLTAVSVTPGWVAKTAGGQDEWLQHRVVSSLQYVFNDDDHTIVTQDTGNAHGPVTLPLPRPGVGLPGHGDRSCRPRARRRRHCPATDPTRGGTRSGFPRPAAALETDLPTPGAQTDDPVDATFAMSALKFFGHQPR